MGNGKCQGYYGSMIWMPAKELGPAMPELPLRWAVLHLHTSSTFDSSHQLWCGPFICPIREWGVEGGEGFCCTVSPLLFIIPQPGTDPIPACSPHLSLRWVILLLV